MALTTIITLITTLANVLLGALGSDGVLSTNLGSLIGDLLSGAPRRRRSGDVLLSRR